METRVECESCGAAYETEAPVAAVKEVPRCQECGARALVVVDQEEEPARAEPRVD